MKKYFKKTKAINFRKRLSIILLIPYMLFFLFGVVNFIKYLVEYNKISLYSFIQPTINFWYNNMIIFNIFFVSVIVYEIFYLIYCFSKQKNKITKLIDKTDKLNKTYIFYVLSFLPYLYLIYCAIFGMNLEIYNFGTSTIYGISAIFLALLMGTMVPIYPIIIVYQIVYTIINSKKLTKLQMDIVKWIIYIIIILLIIPTFLYLFKP